jgi:hypothetical protein
VKDLEEQCACMKFCLKLTKAFTETFQMLKQANVEDCLSLIMVLIVPTSQIRSKVHWRRSQSWTAFHINGR